MSLFGGLDLGTPASRNETTLRRELELRRTHEPLSGWGKVYRTGADLMLQHGRFFSGGQMPAEYEQYVGETGACYWNAVEAAEADPSLTYYEGIVAPGGGRFASHAWCVTADGHVCDFTWHGAEGQLDVYNRLPILPYEHWGYFGVALRPELMRTQDEMPMLGRDINGEASPGMHQTETGAWMTRSGLEVTPPSKLPLLDVPYDPNRTEFPHA